MAASKEPVEAHYKAYQPQCLEFAGARARPGSLLQSAAMATVAFGSDLKANGQPR